MLDGELVVLEGAAKTYGSGDLEVQALRPTTLAIPAGQMVVLLGPSGSGKTTFLDLVGGIEPPTAGRLVVDGQDLAALDREQLSRYRREQVGFVFQFFNLVPTLTALENVELMAELVGRAVESRAALEAVGLGDRLDRFPGALSGGQQQRVAIARALVKQPRLLLCDEPTGSLDLETGRQVLGLLREAAQGGRSVIVVTHNSAIADMADRVVRLRSGEVVEDRRNEVPLPVDEVQW